MEYFKYMKDLLDEQGASHVKIFGGSGGVIIPAEMAELHAYGITRIYSPEDGAKMGLQGMINDMMRSMDGPSVDFDHLAYDRLGVDNKLTIARFISAVQEAGANDPDRLKKILGDLAPAVESKKHPGHRSHRHWRGGEILSDRRTDYPCPERSAGCDHCRDLVRPLPP